MPVTFLTGTSDVQKEEIVKKLLREKDVEYVRIHPEDEDKIDFLKKAIATRSIFSGKRVIDILDFDSWKVQEKNQFLELIKSVPEDVHIFVRTQKAVGKGIALELPKPWESEKWIEYIEKRFRDHGLVVEKDAVQLFYSKVGQNDALIEREIEKLKSYTQTGKVTVQDVEEVVYSYHTPGFDELCFAISEGKRRYAHALLNRFWKTSDPVAIVSALANHFVELYKVVSLVPKKKVYGWTDVSNFSKQLGIAIPRLARFLGFAFKSWNFTVVNHLLYYDSEKVKAILRRLWELDRAVKGEEDPKPFIHEFVEEVSTNVLAVQGNENELV